MLAEKRLFSVKKTIEKSARKVGRRDHITMIAVSKTFPAHVVRPVIYAGQSIFGENRLQEAEEKWLPLRDEMQGIELHLIGPLQSNKVKQAVALFDVIHTVDREKIAKILAKEIRKQKKKVDLFVQVNTGKESQKSGISPCEVLAFIQYCKAELGLSIHGLMCIPPINENPEPHFSTLRQLSREGNLPNLSMGMSSDFQIAIELGATHVRLGHAIFGSR
ncbi:YggS family pyridoxal phosphate-dependent enzyme [Candidatus Endowatersipora endosymbiont of Watersipora subatra]|uniref:YggS family pyridoxal phosphate-dependent enzyme n=1 Tax=Candidatus Endowatersipora endosymbiont of Watersipora subatra TaxID=3077946 RepID=UPI00312CB99E